MKQLTLADVEPGQYFQMTEIAMPCYMVYVGSYLDGEFLWWFMDTQSGVKQSRSRDGAQKIPVELMELVPKDRDSDLLEAVEELFKHCSISPRSNRTKAVAAYDAAREAIANHKGESA